MHQERAQPKSARAPRRDAWEFLEDAERDGSYINLAIGPFLKKLDVQDRPFATELIYGSVRMRRWLDDVVDQVVDRQLDNELRSLLRLACYEALLMNSADHAVVNEYVEIAKAVIGKARSGLVNAVMRRVVRERDELRRRRTSLGVMTSHPDWIVEVYRKVVGESELEHELRSHNLNPPVHAVSFASLPEEYAEKSPVTPHGYRLKTEPRNIPDLVAGSAFVQDEGSQLVCEIALGTDPDRRYRWLDLCAGPGGKFAYLAHFLDSSHLRGNELHQHRANLIAKRAPRHSIHVGDGRALDPAQGVFDRIILDAPCTGLGALRRRPDARWRKTESDLKELTKLQRELLDSAANLVNDGGVIIYVTCSPHPLETTVQVSDFLHRQKGFRIRPVDRNSIPEALHWAINSDGTLQLLTGRDGCDAMFLAMLEKGAA